MKEPIPPDRFADLPLTACAAPSIFETPRLAPSPERWPWWLRAPIFAGLAPLAWVPFVPFVYDVTPWNDVVHAIEPWGLEFGAKLVAAQSLLGPVVVALSVRFLLGLTPGRFERGFAWVVAAVASGFGVCWWVDTCIEIVDRWPIHPGDGDDDLSLMAAFLVLPVCLAIGTMWLRHWRRESDRRIARLTVVLRLALVADLGALIALFGSLPRDIGWYSAVLSCVVVAAELVLLGVSGSPSQRGALPPIATDTGESGEPRRSSARE